MEIADIKKTKRSLRAEVVRCYKWTCPNCDEEIESECETMEQFLDILTTEGVRYVNMKHMQGVFCQTCYLDPEVQNSSL